jgi:hypothetical protein
MLQAQAESMSLLDKDLLLSHTSEHAPILCKGRDARCSHDARLEGAAHQIQQETDPSAPAQDGSLDVT